MGEACGHRLVTVRPRVDVLSSRFDIHMYVTIIIKPLNAPDAPANIQNETKRGDKAVLGSFFSFSCLLWVVR